MVGKIGWKDLIECGMSDEDVMNFFYLVDGPLPDKETNLLYICQNSTTYWLVNDLCRKMYFNGVVVGFIPSKEDISSNNSKSKKEGKISKINMEVTIYHVNTKTMIIDSKIYYDIPYDSAKNDYVDLSFALNIMSNHASVNKNFEIIQYDVNGLKTHTSEVTWSGADAMTMKPNEKITEFRYGVGYKSYDIYVNGVHTEKLIYKGHIKKGKLIEHYDNRVKDSSLVTIYTYETDGWCKAITEMDSGVVYERDYNEYNELMSATYYGGGKKNIVKYVREYNDIGNPTYVREIDGSRIKETTYIYKPNSFEMEGIDIIINDEKYAPYNFLYPIKTYIL